MRRSRKSLKIPKKKSPRCREFRGNAPISTPKKLSSNSGSVFTGEQLRAVSVADDGHARALMDAFESVGGDEVKPSDEVVSSVAMEEFHGKSIPVSMVHLLKHVADAKFKNSWTIVCWVHATYKADVYTGAHLTALQDVNARRAKLEMKTEALGIPKDERWKTLADDDTLTALMNVANQFKILADHCRLKARNLESGSSVATLATGDRSIKDRLVDFRAELNTFAHNSLQPEITDFVAKLLLAFFQNPYFPRSKFFSLMFVSPPGTGKTTIARDISRVLVTSGLFEGGFADKGKSDFIGQYLGQTPHITKNTLITYALEGVLFIDEAYSLCNKDDKGKVDMYGSEFATVLVDFMTRFKGLNCIITAGYEPEMKSQFLAANDGLPRRFPHRFVLNDLNTDQLMGIVTSFNRGIVTPKSTSEDNPLSSEANKFVRNFISRVRKDRGVQYPTLHRLIENQAGSAGNIAEFMAMFTEGGKGGRFFRSAKGVLSEAGVRDSIQSSKHEITTSIAVDSLKNILVQGEMSNKAKALKEFADLEAKLVKL